MVKIANFRDSFAIFFFIQKNQLLVLVHLELKIIYWLFLKERERKAILVYELHIVCPKRL